MRWTAAVATVLVVSLSATAPSSAQSVPTSTTTTTTPVGVAQPPVKPPPLVLRHFPAPPLGVGCYRFHSATTNIDAWHKVACATPAYIATHFPHPEVLSGVSGSTGVGGNAAPFALSVLSVHPVQGQIGPETDSQQGTKIILACRTTPSSLATMESRTACSSPLKNPGLAVLTVFVSGR